MRLFQRPSAAVYACTAILWIAVLSWLFAETPSMVSLELTGCNLVLGLAVAVPLAIGVRSLKSRRPLLVSIVAGISFLVLIAGITTYCDFYLSCALDYPAGCL